MRNYLSDIEECVYKLKAGGVLVYPADTIWGVGCDARNEKAVSRVFDLKKRPLKKSLVVLVGSSGMLHEYVKEIPEGIEEILATFDGPLTVIYPSVAGMAESVYAGDGSVGIRIVRQGWTNRLIRAAGFPLVSTSANISGVAFDGTFDDIPEDIIRSADGIVDPALAECTGEPSRILKLGPQGQWEWIR